MIRLDKYLSDAAGLTRSEAGRTIRSTLIPIIEAISSIRKYAWMEESIVSSCFFQSLRSIENVLISMQPTLLIGSLAALEVSPDSHMLHCLRRSISGFGAIDGTSIFWLWSASNSVPLVLL